MAEYELVKRAAFDALGNRVTTVESVAARADSTAIAASDGVKEIERGEPASDGSVVAIAIDNVGQVMRIQPDGALLKQSQEGIDLAATQGVSAGVPDYEGGVVTETLNGQPLERVMPDGKDFKPSAKLIRRLRDAGVGGGGLTSNGWATAPDDSFTAQAAQHGLNAVDRFIDRADGVRLPVPLVNGVRRKAIIVSGYGQSLADVTVMADPLVWDTPPYPHHAFMLDDMNSIASGNLRGGMNGWSGVAVQRGTRMINASEAARLCQSHGSAAFARLAVWGGDYRRVAMIRSSAWGGNRIIGTTPDTGIHMGSTGIHTQSWINWTGDISQSHQFLTEAGYDVEAIYILFHHQQADWQTSRADYLAQFLAMKADRDSLIAAEFPGMKVHWFCGQAGGSGYRTGSYEGGLWPSRLAIVDACKPENGGDNITMVMPEYWARTGAERGVTENTAVIHVRHDDRPLWGEHIAHAIHAVEQGRPWNCPEMQTASVVGNDVVIDFKSEWPILIDPTFCKVRPDMGFTVAEGAIAVTAVQQTGQRQITITCASDPTGRTVEYAYRQQVPSDLPRDENLISTGAVRDAWVSPSLFDPYGRRVLRPALAGQLTL